MTHPTLTSIEQTAGWTSDFHVVYHLQPNFIVPNEYHAVKS
ncbi:MAG: hypothetical protein ABJF05_08705 [Paracoccaceae bacterium]